MDRHGIRYTFEHRALPQWFFEDKEMFIGTLLHDKNVLYRVINSMFEGEGVENPYIEDDFEVVVSKVTDDVKMLKIVFPEPEEEPLCYSSYMFFDDNFEKISYFCIEKGNTYGEDYPFVCSWTKEGEHENYGNCTFEKYDDFLRCADIHMENMYGLKRKTIETEN